MESDATEADRRRDEDMQMKRGSYVCKSGCLYVFRERVKIQGFMKT